MVYFLWSLVSVSHQLRARNPSTKLPPSCWPVLTVPAGTMRPAGEITVNILLVDPVQYQEPTGTREARLLGVTNCFLIGSGAS